MVSPVFGFLPVLALRWETEKVPKPEMFTLSPFFKAATMPSKTPLTISSAFCLGRSALLATESIKSAFVIFPPPSRGPCPRDIAFYNHTRAPVSIRLFQRT